MAYKFQLGAARLGGTLTQDGQILAEDSTLSGSSLSLLGTAVTANATELNFLDGFAEAAYTQGADSIVFFDADDSKFKRDSNADFLGAISKNGIEVDSNQLQVALDGGTLAQGAGGLSVANDGIDSAQIALGALDTEHYSSGSIENGHLKGSIANAKLANSAITIAGTSTALGGTITAATIAGAIDSEAMSLTAVGDLDGAQGNLTIFDTLNAERTLTIGASNGTVAIAGNLTVNGTTTTVNSTTVNITSSLTFEGPADDHETTLGVVGPTADRAINLADSAGTLVPFAAAPAAGTQISATPAELNSLASLSSGRIVVGNGSNTATAVAVSGDATLSNAGVLTLADFSVSGSRLHSSAISGQTQFDADTQELQDGDELLLSDGGELKRIAYSVLRNTINVGAAPVIKVHGSTLQNNRINYMANLTSGSNHVLSLPAASDLAPGMSFRVKAGDGLTATRFVTITGSGAILIDGQSSIKLESPFAAVNLMYVATNDFRIF